MGLAETAELAVRISLKDGLSGGLGKLNGSLSRFDRGLGRAGKGVGQLGTGFVRAGLVVGGAVVTGLTAAAAAAIEFDDAFAGVKKTVDEADLAAAGLTFDDLARSFRDMATEIPVAASELARIGEAAGALGIRAQDIDDFTETVAKLGVTTDLTTDQAAEALGKIGTILNLTGKDFERFSDTLVNLGNKGASTESEIIEITKRFAAAGRQAGLTTDEILALASATASLGIEPEAAGGALSRIFANLATNIALVNAKGKAFSKAVGIPIKELQRDINKGKGLPILLKFLEQIKGLSRTDAAKVLAGVGITNTRDRDAILKLAQNYGFLNEQLEIAKDSTGALSEEAQKRFATVRSSLQLLRNNLIEAALTIGGDANDPKSFIGSIGVAARKLSEFLKDPENKRELENFGKSLGKAISDIDFDKLLKTAKGIGQVLKPALDTLLAIAKLIAKLPPELTGAGGGIIIANQLSGGAIGAGIGNIVGGLGEVFAKSLISRVPLLGRAFVQPVFVTNMGVGGLGGGGVGAPGGGGGVVGTALKIVLPVAGAILIANAIKGLAGISDEENTNRQNSGQFGPRSAGQSRPSSGFTGQVSGIGRSVPMPIDPKSFAPSIAATKSSIADLRERLARAIANGNETAANRIRAKLDEQKARLAQLRESQQAAADRNAQNLRKVGSETISGNNLQRSANAKLDAIRHKKTSFTARTTVNVSTNVSVRDIARANTIHTRVARTGTLVAS